MMWLKEHVLLLWVVCSSAIRLPTGFLTDNRCLVSQAERRPWRVQFRDYLVENLWPRSASISTEHRREFRVQTMPSRYMGEMVLRFRLNSGYEADEASALNMAAKVLFLDIWNFNRTFYDIRLSRDAVSSLLSLLPASLHNAHTPLIHDLAHTISESHPSLTQNNDLQSFHASAALGSVPRVPGRDSNLFFQQYQPLAVIQPWMRLLRSLFPTHVRIFNLGISSEGREIQALRVGVRPSPSSKGPATARKTIVIAAGSHAREWISTSTVNFVAYSFVTGYGRSREITRLLEKFDFVFIPTINPDGYFHSWEVDRLWRKNRQQTSLPFCTGIDIDRSFGHEWIKNPEAAGPCEETYPGEFPFEAFEARNLANWAKNETSSGVAEIVAFLDFHSYSQQILYPYSFSCTSTPPSLENMEEVAIGMAKSIRTESGQLYDVTSACETSPLSSCQDGATRPSTGDDKTKQRSESRRTSAAGSALDYFYSVLGVPYAYQIKLRDQGAYGFLLPERDIIPTGREASKAVEYLGKFLAGDKGIEEKGIHDDIELSHLTGQNSFVKHNRRTAGDLTVVDDVPSKLKHR